MATCASCGAENPPANRFCGVVRRAARARPRRRASTRKTVTVVFCDVTGSTALGERLDPESAAARHGALLRRDARAIVERHGGTVEKFIGDAVMAVFGVPTCTRTTRSARSARRSRCATALATLNAELERDYGVTLELRTGVNTGEVVDRAPRSGSRPATPSTSPRGSSRPPRRARS